MHSNNNNSWVLTYPLKCSHDSSWKSNASGLTIPLHRDPNSQLQKTNPSATIRISQPWNNSYLTWLQFHKSCYCVCRFHWQTWLKGYGDKDFLGLIFINAKNLSQYSSVNTLCFLFFIVQHWFVIYTFFYFIDMLLNCQEHQFQKIFWWNSCLHILYHEFWAYLLMKNT